MLQIGWQNQTLDLILHQKQCDRCWTRRYDPESADKILKICTVVL